MQLSAEVQTFLLDHVDSVAELEALLLLRNEPGPWTAPELASRLFIAEDGAAAVLSTLERHRLARSDDGRYRYAPADDGMAAIVDRVAYAYAHYLIPVTHVIHSKPRSNIQRFADAFRLREKKP